MSWLGPARPLDAAPHLEPLVVDLQVASAAAVPGRLHELLVARTARLLGGEAAPPPSDLTPAERAVLDVADQFLVDVHGLTDADVARLGEWFTPAEQVAILFDLALADGLTRFERVLADPPVESPGGAH